MSSIENKVCIKILDRAEVGEKKYGITMERTDLSTIDWIKHAQEEAMDLSVYLEKILELLTKLSLIHISEPTRPY